MIIRQKTTHPYKPAKLAKFEIITWEEPEFGCWTQTARQIIEKSKQERIQRTVPKDTTVRFKDIDTYKVWASTGKLFFALTDYSGDVGGLIWFSKHQHSLVPEADTTFAIRIYDGYEGRGLAKPFMSVAHFLLPKLMAVSPHVWLETDTNNAPALLLYQSFGYRHVETSETERVLMSYHGMDE
jgi:hypothetical protein